MEIGDREKGITLGGLLSRSSGWSNIDSVANSVTSAEGMAIGKGCIQFTPFGWHVFLPSVHRQGEYQCSTFSLPSSSSYAMHIWTLLSALQSRHVVMSALLFIIRRATPTEKIPTISTQSPHHMSVLEKKTPYSLRYDGASSSPPLVISAWECSKNMP
eukprot:5475065-Ditylum_brightwellii.AAC.1